MTKRYDELSVEEEKRALVLHKESIVVDALNSVMRREDYIPRILQGGITAFNLTTSMPSPPTPLMSDFREALKSIDSTIRTIEKHSDKMLLVTSVNDILRAKEEKKCGVILGFQHMPIEDDLSHLRTLYRLGVRIMQLTYMTTNLIGSGCGERIEWQGGLTFFGRDVVEEMNRLGMLIDLSHVGDKTTEDAIECSKDLVVGTHVSSRAFINKTRNKPDEHIIAIGKKGGVIGIPICPGLISDKPWKGEIVTIEDYLDNLDYIIKLAGIDHVGIGTDSVEVARENPELGIVNELHMVWLKRRPDMETPTGKDGNYYPLPTGLDTVAKLPNVTKGLVARGYSDGDIKKILGENWLRVFKKVWK